MFVPAVGGSSQPRFHDGIEDAVGERWPDRTGSEAPDLLLWPVAKLGQGHRTDLGLAIIQALQETTA